MLLYFPQILQTSAATSNATNGNGNMLGWIIGGILALVALWWVSRPLVNARPARQLSRPEMSSEPARLSLENVNDHISAEKQSLADLEFDRDLGLLEDSEYQSLKENYSSHLSELSDRASQLQEHLSPVPVVSTNSKVAGTKNGVKSVAKASSTAMARAAEKTATKTVAKPATRQVAREKYKCGECGTAFKPGSKFCVKCNAPLPLLCLNCGREVTEDDRFCPKCGSAVNT